MVGMWQGNGSSWRGNEISGAVQATIGFAEDGVVFQSRLPLQPHSTRSKTLAKVIMLSTVGHHVGTYSVKNDKGKTQREKNPSRGKNFQTNKYATDN
jgi:hypothetical protein